MTALSLSKVGHAFLGRKVLTDITLTVAKGEIVALVGPSGCGKSTLIHLAAGIFSAVEGDITASYQCHGMVFQDPRLMPWATAFDNIAYPLKLMKTPRAARAKQVETVAKHVALLAEDLTKYPVELSGGMRQRVAIARALAAQPDFIFFDEPFTALDAALKRRMQDLVIENAAKTGIGGLFVTHDLAEAARVAHRIIVLDSRGRGIKGERTLFATPGQRSDGDLFSWVQQAKTQDPLFAQIHDVDERAF